MVAAALDPAALGRGALVAAPPSSLRGRDREWEAVSSALRCARSSTSSAVVIEGHAGAGCTRFLAAVAEVAGGAGFSVVSGSASRVTCVAPLTPLLEAIDALPYGPNGGWVAKSPSALLDEAAARLTRQTGRRPTVVVLDDLQWADPMLLAALRILSVRLRSYPLVWALARHAGEADPCADEFVREFETMLGAARVLLSPLDTAAVGEIVADLLRAEPDDDVVALANRAGGNPGLLNDLVLGSRRDGTIAVVDGRAVLRSWRPPERLERNVLHRLERLTAAARQFVEVGALLGSVFEFDDVIRLMATPASKTLPVLRELLDAGVVLIGDEGCCFASDLFREAVVETLPAPAREAIHLQVAEILLARGDDAAAASHLKHSHARDAHVLLGLSRAMGQVLDLTDQAPGGRALADPGVRGRHTTRSERPSSGWASLTETELTVANLVTQGLTNRRIAQRMFLSSHTVAYHLRHIFAKLDIASRVDLARLGAQMSRETSKYA